MTFMEYENLCVGDKVRLPFSSYPDQINHTGYAKINKQGYADMNIGNTEILKEFKKKYISDISFEPLNRKWDKINLDYNSRYVKTKKAKDKAKDLYERNYSITDISNILNLSYSTIYSYIKGRK